MIGRTVTPSNSTTAMASLSPRTIIHDMGTTVDDTDNINTGKGPLNCSFEVVHPGADAEDATPTIHNTKRGNIIPPCFTHIKCPTSVIDISPFEWRDIEGRRVPARAEASLLPTADDYANLYFCESSEEEEAGATSATVTSTKQNKRKRQRVSFCVSLPTIHLLADTPPCHTMTPQEKSARWLSRSDLEALKSSARRSVQEIRNRIQADRDGSAVVRRSEFRALMIAMEDETGSSVRGLEHRVFRRENARRELIRDVLECQSHVAGLARFGHAMDGEEKARLLARASWDRSFKARGVAYADARDDRREVCGDGGVDAKRTLKRQRKRSNSNYEVSDRKT